MASLPSSTEHPFKSRIQEPCTPWNCKAALNSLIIGYYMLHIYEDKLTVKGTWLCLWQSPPVSDHAETKLRFCGRSQWSMLSVQPDFLWQMHEYPVRDEKNLPHHTRTSSLCCLKQINNTMHCLFRSPHLCRNRNPLVPLITTVTQLPDKHTVIRYCLIPLVSYLY